MRRASTMGSFADVNSACMFRGFTHATNFDLEFIHEC